MKTTVSGRLIDESYLTPALIDGKDITSDFEGFFDDEAVIRRDDSMLGYIYNIPVKCIWCEHTQCVKFHILSRVDLASEVVIKAALEIERKRLVEYNKDEEINQETTYTWNADDSSLYLFYWWRK